MSRVAPGSVAQKARRASSFTTVFCSDAAASRQPALAAAVVLHVAEASPAARGQSQVELLDVLVGPERLGLAIHHHAAVLEDVAVVGIAQRDGGVLLREEE